MENETEAIAYKLWKSMMPQINKIIVKIEGYSDILEKTDYINQAFIACVEAVKRYSEIVAVNMTLKTYAFWYIQKELYRMAEMAGDVVFVAHAPDGEHTIFSNSRYRKEKKKLESAGYRFTSEKMVVHFEDGDKMATAIKDAQW